MRSLLYKITICFLLVPFSSFSQKFDNFILKDHKILDVKKGFLNNDSIPDAVLILKSYKEDIPDSAYKEEWNRPLLVLLGQKGGGYKLIARADSLVLCLRCGGMMGDPYSNGLEIKDHSILLSFYGGSRFRWTKDLEFKFDKKLNNFVLKKEKDGSYDSLSPDSTYQVRPRPVNARVVTIEKYRLSW